MVISNLGTGDMPPGTVSILVILVEGVSPFSRFWYKERCQFLRFGCFGVRNGLDFHDFGKGTVSIFTILLFEEWKIGIRSGMFLCLGSTSFTKFYQVHPSPSRGGEGRQQKFDHKTRKQQTRRISVLPSVLVRPY